MRADLCFDAATEGATGGMLLCRPPVGVAKRRPRQMLWENQCGQREDTGQVRGERRIPSRSWGHCRQSGG